MAYAKWAGKRLLTEAEWEKAARGGLVNKRFPWGDEDPGEKRANYTIVGKLSPVGTYPSNGYGLYDMAGNVCEWCPDPESSMDKCREAQVAGILRQDLSLTMQQR